MMAISGHKDPNRGPFKLQYDVTPQDLTEYNPTFDIQNQQQQYNFRYKGFSTKPVEEAGESRLEAHDNLSLPTFPSKRWLDTNKPLATGTAKGFKYGSEGHPQEDKPSPRAIRDPFKEHTTAELKKFRKIQEEVDLDFQKMKEHREQGKQKKQREQSRNFKQLNAYDPWGKPGCGAPPTSSDGNNYHGSLMDGPPQLITGVIEDDFYSAFGKAGHGAPLRTDSGKVKTNIKGDALIRFQSGELGNSTVAQGHLRWNRDATDKKNLANELIAQQAEAKRRANDERYQDYQKDLEMAQHHPYGKPGAGAPNSRSTDADQYNYNPSAAGTPDHFKWGQGTGNANRDQYGDVRGYRRATKEGIHTQFNQESPRRKYNFNEPDIMDTSLNLDTSRGGAGAPQVAGDGQITTRMPITMKRDARGDSTIREGVSNIQQLKNYDKELHQVYDPWSKAGGGAPNKDSAGKIRPNVYGKLYSEKHADEIRPADYKREQLNEQRKLIDEQKANLKTQDRELKYGDGEFAGIIRRQSQRTQNGNFHLPSSDVTKQGIPDGPDKIPNQQLYHTELQRLASQRQMERDTEKLRDRQELSQHMQTNSEVWGKPGAGAPLPGGTRKGKLDTLINSPRDVPVDFYNKNISKGKQPYNYVRNTTQSSGNNYYDFDPRFRNTQVGRQNKDYNLDTPWAKADKGEVF